ncbi:MAG: HAMP domain-containing sensor histidine kinase [Clostridium sp.]|nr:HAMP domain-containing sensor histidine kinase [Clostridium sp.]MDU7083020.1 HAMP domain-containing sensor histidine kinase [Clostridium sp.]
MDKISIRKRMLRPLLSYLIVFTGIFFVVFNMIYKAALNESTYSPRFILNTNIFLLGIFIAFITGFTLMVIKICSEISRDIKMLAEDAIKLSKSIYRTEEIKAFETAEIEELNLSIHKLAKRLFDYYRAQKIAMENASHELRTPLMSIQGYAEGIKYKVFDDIEEPLDIIINESKHLRDVVKSMLKLSEMDSFSVKVSYKNMNLYHSLNRILNQLRGVAYKSNKHIKLEGDENFTMNIDEKLLSQAVINIVSNGLRYAKETVVVRFEKAADSVIIHIIDDGDGIKNGDLENIFTRFYKGDKGNFGLGLSIAKSSIEYLGGEITAFNLRKGACFEIKLQRNGHI